MDSMITIVILIIIITIVMVREPSEDREEDDLTRSIQYRLHI